MPGYGYHAGGPGVDQAAEVEGGVSGVRMTYCGGACPRHGASEGSG